MTQKECFKCGKRKPLDDFYKHPGMSDGHLNKCKECAKVDTRQNYRENRDYYIEYEKSRMRQPHRVLARMEYARTDGGKCAMRKAQTKYRGKYPEKYNTHNITCNAIRDGILVRQPCAICGEEKVEAHHDNYNLPLQVTWLCREHHLERHGKQPIRF